MLSTTKQKLYTLVLTCFFEKPEIKKQLHSLVRNFAYKNFTESKKTTKTSPWLSKKASDSLMIEEETSETGLGFVDKFAALFTIRKKLDSVRSDILTKRWTSAYPHVWGNELYNRSVNTQNPFFEKLFLSVMIRLTNEDR